MIEQFTGLLPWLNIILIPVLLWMHRIDKGQAVMQMDINQIKESCKRKCPLERGKSNG